MKTLQIKNNNGIFEVYSSYEPKLLDVFRGLSFRKWDKNKKCWIVGVSSIFEELIPEAKDLGYEIQIDKSLEYNAFSQSHIASEKKEEDKVVDFCETYNNLKLPLRDYQKEGVRFLVERNGALLADDMGTGKSATLIATVQNLNAFPSLIYCPNNIKRQWGEEISKFSNLTYKIIEGGKKERKKLWKKQANFTIVNYECRDEYPSSIEWKSVILDEASRVKNWKTQTHKRILKVKAKRKYCLTGTPVENSITDLFAIFRFVNPGLFVNYTSFKNNFLVTNLVNYGYGVVEDVVAYKNLDELKRQIQPFYLRRTKEQVNKELPELVKTSTFVELNESELKAYNFISNILKNKIESMKQGERLGIGGELTLLRVLCNGEVNLKWSNTTNEKIQHYIRNSVGYSSSKIDELMNLLESLVLHDSNKVVIFSDFTSPFMEIEKKLKDLKISFAKLHSGVKEIDLFKENDDCKVLLAQTKSGGYGLNLQCANQAIFLNRPWNPSVEEQAIARLHRQGQKKTVFVHYLLTSKTIEDKVNATLNEKKEVSEKLIVENSKRFL